MCQAIQMVSRPLRRGTNHHLLVSSLIELSAIRGFSIFFISSRSGSTLSVAGLPAHCPLVVSILTQAPKEGKFFFCSLSLLVISPFARSVNRILLVSISEA